MTDTNAETRADEIMYRLENLIVSMQEVSGELTKKIDHLCGATPTAVTCGEEPPLATYDRMEYAVGLGHEITSRMSELLKRL